jgi:hypothetical protein
MSDRIEVWGRESQSQAETVKASSGKMKRIVVLSCIGLFILLVIPRMFPPNPSDEVRDIGRANAGHDKLMALNKDLRTLALGVFTKDGCVGDRALYMGMDKARNAFWSVGCESGLSYLVEIDPVGNATTWSCVPALSLGKTPLKCFVKLKDQNSPTSN